MSFLARPALRGFALSRTSLLACPRSFTTFTHSPTRTTQRLLVPTFKRKYASDITNPAESATPNISESEVPVNKDVSGEVAGLESEPAVKSQQNSVSSRYSRERDGLAPPAQNKTLYVGNLFFEVTEDQLKQEFERIGPVVSTKIIPDHRGLSKGFGYVEFAELRDATAAIEAFHQRTFEGRRMVVQYHVPRVSQNQSGPRAPNPPSKTLFIGNLSFEMNDTDLNELFREIKNVLDVRVAIDRRSGQPRGFAHADFIDVKSAEQAKEILQGKEIYGRALKIDFSASSRGALLPRSNASS